MSDIPALKKQRATNKGKLTNILKYLKMANDNTPIEEFKTRLTRVEQLMSEFTAIENKIFDLDSTEEPDLLYEENYYTAITGLNTWIRSKSIAAGNISPDMSLNMTNTGLHHEIKLPKINIPPFHGEYTEWQSFYDLFSSTIHESANLSPVQKFQYLKGLLRGEAAVLLRHISITEGNYIGALNKLEDRYNRKRHIINSFVRTFVEQPSINTATASNVKQLMDTSDEVIRGLKALGESAEARDHWLIFLLVQKLDEKSKVLWAQQVADLENPEFSNFLEFLSRRIDTLESTSMSLKRPMARSKVKSHMATRVFKYTCSICNEGDHSLFSCVQFNQMDVINRRNWAKTNSRCINCLSGRHQTDKCNSRRRCQICHKMHHTLLHIGDEAESTTTCNKASSVPGTTASLCSQASSCTILPTALVNVKNSSGRVFVCRALLDSGSQASFVTENCVQRLGMKKSNARLSVTGLGGSIAGSTKGKVILNVQPKQHPVFSLETFILSKITTNLPRYSFEYGTFKQWPNIQLADPKFNRSSDIDILIGADYFFNLMEPEQIKVNHNGLILQKTILGWVVSGVCQNTIENNLLSMLTTNSNVEIDLDKTLQQFWELESVPSPKSNLSPEELLCENHFNNTVNTDPDGRFIVGLPFKKPPQQLGKSLGIAIQRLRTMERPFARDREFHQLYNDFMIEYQKLNHMEEIQPPETSDMVHYLPHHGVLKNTSKTTKLRVVFDGSAKTTDQEYR